MPTAPWGTAVPDFGSTAYSFGSLIPGQNSQRGWSSRFRRDFHGPGPFGLLNLHCPIARDDLSLGRASVRAGHIVYQDPVVPRVAYVLTNIYKPQGEGRGAGVVPGDIQRGVG